MKRFNIMLSDKGKQRVVKSYIENLGLGSFDVKDDIIRIIVE